MQGRQIISSAVITVLLAVSVLANAGGHASAADAAGDSERGLVVVAGATGKTGRLIVGHLLAQGYSVRALVRDIDAARELLGDELDYAEGDVRQVDSLKAAMKDAAAVVSAIGSSRNDPSNGPEFVDYGGVLNLTEAAVATGVDQFVLISSGGVTHEDHVLNRMFDNVLIWKFKGEEALRNSGLAYTIVRPGGLADSPGGEAAVVFMQGDQASGMISRDDVAQVCVASLRVSAARNKTFEVINGDGALPNDYQELFGALEVDP